MASDDPSMLAFASIAKPPPTMAELGVVPCDIDTLATEPPALSAKAVDEEPLLPSPTNATPPPELAAPPVLAVEPPPEVRLAPAAPVAPAAGSVMALYGHLGGLLSGRLGDNRYQVRRARATRPTRRRLKLPRPRQTLHHRRATPQTIAARVAIPNAKLRSAAAPSASANALLRSVATPCACSGITRNASGEASSECRAVPKPYRARTISRNCATSKPRTARSSKGW